MDLWVGTAPPSSDAARLLYNIKKAGGTYQKSLKGASRTLARWKIPRIENTKCNEDIRRVEEEEPQIGN